MKSNIFFICLLCLFAIIGCEVNNSSALNYTECTSQDLINEALREDAKTLSIANWPFSIREYIATEFVGYEVEELTSYTSDGDNFIIAKMSNNGYILFGEDHKFLCADATFNGGSRVDLSFDSSLLPIDTMDMMIDSSDTGMDTTVVDPDTLIALLEKNVCDPNIISFERQILPLLASGCAYSGCHDSETAEDNVILETYTQIRSKVNPGSNNGGKIMKTLDETNMNSDKFMPPLPAISFTDEQTELVREWINQGANNTTCNEPCNSEEISFSQNIYPIIADQCLGCHQPTNDLGGIILDTYENILFSVNDGELLGSIKHETGFDPMPEVALKLTDCQIATIENWINQGAKND